MKKVVLIFLTVLITINSGKGQITTTKVAVKEVQIENTKYDSSRNFLGSEIIKYVGQELYLKEKVLNLREYGYNGFYTHYDKEKSKKIVYKCCDNHNSIYEELYGKYFKVLESVKHPKASGNDFFYENKAYLKLEEKITKDIVYFEYNKEFEYDFPFIVLGFFQKQKTQLLGKEFVFADKVITYRHFGELNPKPSVDIITGKNLTIVTGEKWKCLDLTVEDEFYTLSLILQNSIGEKTTIEYNTIFGRMRKGRAYYAYEADSFKNEFGLEAFNLILKGKCKIGMSKEMCRLSWGEPKNINKTITANKNTEQWVYSDNYLYFDDGILTVIQ